MLISCFSCTRKHLATAITYSHEAVMGYPTHAWLAVGELVNAENEIMRASLPIASMIRQARLQYMLCIEEEFSNMDNVPDFIALIELVTAHHQASSIQPKREPDTYGLFDTPKE